MYEFHLMGGREASPGTSLPARNWLLTVCAALAALALGMTIGAMPAGRGLADSGSQDLLGAPAGGGAPDFLSDPFSVMQIASHLQSAPTASESDRQPDPAAAVAQAANQALQDYQAMADRIPSDKLDHAARDRNLMQSEPAQRKVAGFLAERYSVADDTMRDYVTTARDAARLLHIDPLLILAVMAVESNYRAASANPSGARGLMQVIPEYHGAELAPFGGARALHEPRVNILVGSLVLKQYIALTGSLDRGLRYYVGASDPDTDDQGYVRKVSSELKSLRGVLADARPPSAISAAGP